MLPFDLHYIWPNGVYLTLFIFLFLSLYGWLFLHRQRKRALFIPSLVVEGSPSFYWLRVALLCGCWVCATIALMQPIGQGHYLEGAMAAEGRVEIPSPKRKAHDVILLIDASGSMGVMDSRLGTSRLEYAKEIADQIIAALTGESAALYAFTSQVDELSPMTLDAFFLRMMLQQISINQGGGTGTNLFEAIAKVKKEYFAAPSPKLKTLILISDGGDTAIEAMQGADKKQAVDALSHLVADAKALQLRVYTIGMGSEKGGIVPGVKEQGKDVISKLQPEPLQSLSKVGRGAYYEANRYSSLRIAELVHKQMSEDPPYYDEKEGLVAGSLLQAVLGDSAVTFKHYFQYPLGAALVLLLLALLWPASALWKKADSTWRGFFAVLMCIFLLQAPLFGQDYQAEVETAKFYWNGPFFDKSLAIYRELQEKALTEDQKIRLAYNIGTTYLAQGDFNQAIQQFNATAEDASPLVVAQIQHNLAIAHARLAFQLQAEGNQEYGALFYHFEQALLAIKKSLAAHCQLQAFLGVSPCVEPLALQRFHQEMEKQLALLRIKEAEDKLLHTSLDNGILKIEKYLEKMAEMIAFMSNEAMDKSLQAKYLALFVANQKELLLFWSQQEQKIEDPATLDLLTRAKQHYLAMQQAFAHKKWQESDLALKETSADIEMAIQAIFGDALLRKRLEELFLSYRSAASSGFNRDLSKELDKAYLQIQELATQGSDLEKAQLRSIQNPLARSKEQLQMAIEFFQAGKDTLGSLFLENAGEWVKEAIFQLAPATSKELLLRIIAAQELCMRLCSFDATRHAAEASSLLRQAKELQSLTLVRANAFIPLVYREQQQQYREKGICQASPWSVALPLFEEGKRAATAASHLLNQQQVPESVAFQQQAIEAWKKTMHEIVHPSPIKKGGCRDEQNQAESKSEAAVAEALQLLQSMEQDDRMPQASPTLTETSRPW